jgi:hypothetical protein
MPIYKRRSKNAPGLACDRSGGLDRLESGRGLADVARLRVTAAF